MNYKDIGILVVEDNPGDARLLCEMLGETVYATARCHMVGTLKEARAAARTLPAVATVLLDLSLPDSDGMATLRGIREVYADCPIIIITGLDDEDTAIQALREGAQHYMIKDELTASSLGRTLRYSIERQGFIKRLRDEEQRSQELRDNERTIQAALEREQRLNALKSRFVSLVSHEFRTPLAVIQGSVDLIDRYAAGPEMLKVQRHASRIQTKVRELTVMLGDVLDVERLEQHVVRCSPAEFDIDALGDQVLAEMRPLARAGQRLVHEQVGKGGMVLLDPLLLTKVLTNLLSNAIKYSPENSTITLRTVVDDRRVHLFVRDEGMGIPEKDHGLLFERFYRGSNVGSSQGTGLGLNIVQQYVDLLGGHISFSSVPGNTVFEVELPRRSCP